MGLSLHVRKFILHLAGGMFLRFRFQHHNPLLNSDMTIGAGSAASNLGSEFSGMNITALNFDKVWNSASIRLVVERSDSVGIDFGANSQTSDGLGCHRQLV